MSMGRRRREQQDELFLTPDRLPVSAGHPFFNALNRLLAECGFDGFVEQVCRPFYQPNGTGGRPSIPPGVYFRMLLVGYFEGIQSQRGIVWRCEDSLAIRSFLGLALTDSVPDHSSLTRIRDRLSKAVHDQVFRKVLELAVTGGLLAARPGDHIAAGIDSTSVEANAAMKSIVRRDSGEDYMEYLRGLAAEAGMKEPTDDELRAFDRTRKGKKCSNEDWESPADPDARIARMKDGTTHLAYKVETAVDLNSGLILATEVHAADRADTLTMTDTLAAADAHLDAIVTLLPESEPEAEASAKSRDGKGAKITDLALDKGYWSTKTAEQLDARQVRGYIAQPKRRQRRKWSKRTAGERRAVENARRRANGPRGKELQRLRAEKVERTFAHLCETGGCRRAWVRGSDKVQKRLTIASAAQNLGLVMLALFGVGRPKSLQSLANSATARLRAFAAGLAEALDNLGDPANPRNTHFTTLRRLLSALLAPLTAILSRIAPEVELPRPGRETHKQPDSTPFRLKA